MQQPPAQDVTIVTQRTCDNCGHPLHENDHFCSHCGQDTHHTKLPFKHFFLEFLEGVIHFDTKVWLTLRQFLKSPGYVIKNFNDNKRVRYVPPLRLYIFSSVIFFLLLSGGVKDQAKSFDQIMEKDGLGDGFSVSLFFVTEVDSISASRLQTIPNITATQVDSVLTLRQIPSTHLNNRIISQLVKLRRRETSAQEIGYHFLASISKILFLLMPLFAFFVMVINGYKKLFYAEALVFSIYMHSCYFLLMIVAVLVNKVVHLPNLYSIVFFATAFYLVTSMKIAFQNKWLTATYKALLLIIIYLVVIVLALALAFVTSLIL
jgi:hypothetical protein